MCKLNKEKFEIMLQNLLAQLEGDQQPKITTIIQINLLR